MNIIIKFFASCKRFVSLFAAFAAFMVMGGAFEQKIGVLAAALIVLVCIVTIWGCLHDEF